MTELLPIGHACVLVLVSPSSRTLDAASGSAAVPHVHGMACEKLFQGLRSPFEVLKALQR